MCFDDQDRRIVADRATTLKVGYVRLIAIISLFLAFPAGAEPGKCSDAPTGAEFAIYVADALKAG